jgi:hypothetical protein
MSGVPPELRSDFDAAKLRAAARQTKNGPQARRLLSLAAIYEGASRTQAGREVVDCIVADTNRGG